jgi:uncharacterized membrane protein
MADGSLIFDTQIDTNSSIKELAQLRASFLEVSNEIKQQNKVLGKMESEYEALGRAAAFESEMLTSGSKHAAQAFDAMGKDISIARNELAEMQTRAALYKDQIRETTAQIRDQARESVAAYSEMGKAVSKLTAKISAMLKQAFIFTIMYKALSSLKSAIRDAAKENVQLGNAMARVRAATASFSSNLVAALAPALTKIINWLAKAINYVTAFVNLLSKEKGVANSASSALKNEGKAAIGVGKAAKKAEGSLTNFDEINKLTADTAADSADSLSSAATVLGDMSDSLKEPDLKWITWMEDHLGLIKTAVNAIGLAFLLWKLGNKKGGIIEALDGLRKKVKSLRDQAEKGINWENLAENAEGSAELIDGLRRAFGVKGAAAGAILAGLADTISATRDQLKNGLNWANITQNIGGQAELIWGVYNAFGGRAAGVVAIGTGLADIILATRDQLKKGLTWENITQGIAGRAQLIWGVYNAFCGRAAGVVAIGTGLADIIQANRDQAEKGINWQNITLELSGKAELIWGLYKAFNGRFVGVIAAGMGLADIIQATRDQAEKGITWQNLTQGIAGVTQLIIGLSRALGSIVKGSGVGAGILLALYMYDKMMKDIDAEAPKWKIALELVAAGLGVVSAAMIVLNASNPIGWIALAIAAIVALGVAIYENWDKIKGWMRKIRPWIKEWIVDPVVKFFKNMWDGIKKGAKAGWDYIVDIWKGVSTWFKEHITDPIKNAFSNLWDNIKNGVGAAWKAIVDKIKSWLSKIPVIGKMFKDNSGGKSSSRSANLLDSYTNLLNPSRKLQVPALAAGAVIPPNNPYLTVVGDQKTGTNIETPLDTMVQAFRIALSEQNYGTSQAQIVVDGVTFGELVWKYNQAQGTRIGANLVTRGG